MNPFSVQGKANYFVRTGDSEAETEGNKIQLARTDDVNVYIEYCKKSKPNIRLQQWDPNQI